MPIVGQFGSLAGLGSMILPGGAFESIATVTVSGTSTTDIIFDNIPGTYQHLQLRYIARNVTAAVGSVGLSGRFNDDSGSNYTNHLLYGDGASALAAANTSLTNAIFGNVVRDNETASVYAGGVVDILDYASTSKNKTLRMLQGFDSNNTSGFVVIRSGMWMSTNAITKIFLFSGGSAAFKEHSHFALYGIKAP